MKPPATLKARLSQARKELEDAYVPKAFEAGRSGFGLSLAKRMAELLDRELHDVFATANDTGIALAAVGGYGRGVLGLRSDLDLRLLARSPESAERVVDAIIYPLWDAGFSVGHQTLLMSDVLDLAREDLSTATSLLDWRFLAGDRALSDELVWRAAGGIFSPSELGRFCSRLTAEMEKRHERFGASVYLLEPDVKSGPGGLRDLDLFRWANAARHGCAEIEALLRVGAMAGREAQELSEAEDRLWRIRHLLHFHAGRRSDRLTFDEQEHVASILEQREGAEGVEQLMSDYYRAARTISRAVRMTLAKGAPASRERRPKEEDLGDGLRLFDGAITLADTGRLEREPSLSLRLIQVAVDRGRPLYLYAREAIMRLTADLGWCERLRKDPSTARLFVDLLALRKETALLSGSAVREMHDLGLLLAVIPEFAPVVGRVHHDAYHVFTVDVHSVAAVDRLAALYRGDLAVEHPIASRLAAEVFSYPMLAMATLLHDVGKAIGGHEHSQRGAEMAPAILERLAMSCEEIEAVSHLIANHLLMYRLATRRDVDDRATQLELATAVGSRERLRHLFLLTVVDVGTTSPTSMNSWKAHMLDELYIATDNFLSGQSGESNRVERLRSEIANFAEGYLLGAETAPPQLEFLPKFLSSMPDRYLLSSSAQAVVAHADVVRRHDRDVSIEIVPSSHPDAAELCVVADDRPGLLAMISAALAGARLEVLGAQIYTRESSSGTTAVDLFWVQARVDGIAGVPRVLDKVLGDLRRLIEKSVTPLQIARLPTQTRLRGPKVRTRVSVDNRASVEHTVVEVTTVDQPGVLFAIAHSFFELGLSIAIAKINTEGARVADVFYVTDGGKKLLSPARIAEVQHAIRQALGEPNAEDAPSA